MSDISYYAYNLGSTPYFSWFNSGVLLSTPFISPSAKITILINSKQPSSIFNLFKRSKFIGPTNKTTLFFGISQALGGWIIYDGDIESGSGFLAVWSSLYLIVGGGGLIKAAKYGKFWPLFLSTLNGTGALLYGKEFIFNEFK